MCSLKHSYVYGRSVASVNSARLRSCSCPSLGNVQPCVSGNRDERVHVRSIGAAYCPTNTFALVNTRMRVSRFAGSAITETPKCAKPTALLATGRRCISAIPSRNFRVSGVAAREIGQEKQMLV